MKYSIFLLSAVYALSCFSMQQKTNKRKKNSVKDEKIVETEVEGGYCITFGDNPVDHNNDSKDSKRPKRFSKKRLREEIRADISRTFTKHLLRVEIDWLEMAGGNEELANDIEILYNNFTLGGQQTLQKKLDLFCKKWKLEHIEFADIFK